MPCSEKKLQANRANALKSTGPKSKAGKAKVALNPLRHGLRSPHIVLPGEDASAFDEMMQTWMGEWKPPTDTRRVLVELSVAHAWRLRRCLKVERDHLVERGIAAVRDHHRGAAARVRAAITRLDVEPEAALTDLLAEREGAVAVLGLWEGLAEAAGATGSWDDFDAHHSRLLRLLGMDDDCAIDEDDGPAFASWCLLGWNDPELSDDAEDRPADQAAADALAKDLATFLAAQVSEIKEYVATTFPTAEEHAARLTSAAALDDSAEGRALLRYEGQHGRQFRATLNQLIKLTQTNADLVEASEEETEPETVVSEVVESSPTEAPSKATGPASEAPSKATEARVMPSNATEDGPDGLPSEVSPDRTGSRRGKMALSSQ